MYKDADGDLHLGFLDDTNCFFGRTLIRLACGDYQTFAYSLDSPICSPVDVTEWFISEYKEKGECAYTKMRHGWNENHKDSAPDGTTRTCIYCDKVETLKYKMVRKIWWD
ncbi:hypothetical protein ERJ77_01825 [Vibrio anguillarum]|uniref:Uncharacterized protein n=1 Tax=Vibrio anguillarum TaxID=55601 RepID=A0AAW4B8G8_VIBAN|nr:hypothetical protein [Vibrio anguillarum]MBF4433251.1 hypothetical protein [Vibrio anguillarum]